MTSHDLRELFLKFFESTGHTRVPSSSLVPGNDPTLLFTNAGMVPFKDVFLGHEQRPYVRATSSQKCVRAGGKHNDLENVGYTARHHTFFEMLGNFSFGDYFKQEAIEQAWTFMTGKQWLGLDPTRLLVTVYAEDDEAFELWRRIAGLPEDRILRIGDHDGKRYVSDNFWQMADTGPCGPCSEIFYDHGPEIAGGPPGSPEADGDRWVEIWNLVFMQFDRAPDGSMTPLPKPSVDTGMGLERLAAVMQGVHNNYDTDLFKALRKSAAGLAVNTQHDNSLRVVADHIRASAFLIADGVHPSNEGRGYVLRRIIRRALRHGWKLGSVGDFFWRMAEPLAREMGDAYPELRSHREQIESILNAEEKRFAETLDKGMVLLEEAMRAAKDGVIAGPTVFKLYDTFGFPVDLTADIAREKGLRIDESGYEKAMAQQRDRARAASSFSADYSASAKVDAQTTFTGYVEREHEAKIIAILVDSKPVQTLQAGQDAVVILDNTPFYAEAGGQVGDTGVLSHTDPDLLVPAGEERTLEVDNTPPVTGRGPRVPSASRGGPESVFRVHDTRAIPPDTRGHIGKLESGMLQVGDYVIAEIDWQRRMAVMRNHSATHLLHAALRKRLGPHVVQKGSLVAPDRLRFDFSHHEVLTPEDLELIENLVNEQVLQNIEAETEICAYQDAIDRGVMALFGEKYGDEVRVLRFGGFSMELCGGTHVARSGDIGLFKIVSESGVAAGVRRVEAVTGEGALAYVRANESRLRQAAELLRSGRGEVPDKLRQLLERARQLEKELSRMRDKLASNAGGDLSSSARTVAGIQVLAAMVDGADAGSLRKLMDQLKQKLGSAAIVLGSGEPGKVSLIAGVTEDLTSRLKAGELVNAVAQQVGGKGGGRADMAQAGGSDFEALPGALDSVHAWIEDKLS